MELKKVNLFETDFVIVYKDTNEPYESCEDLTAHIYSKEGVEEFTWDGGNLESTHPDCKWLTMTELSKENQNKYINAIKETREYDRTRRTELIYDKC